MTDVFSREFLEEHLIDDANLRDFITLEEWRSVDLSRITERSLRGARIASKNNRHGRGKFILATDGFDFPQLPTMHEAYWALKLAPEIEAIRESIRDNWPGARTSIHVRRGDVVSGWFRLGGGSAKKALPVPIVRELAVRLSRGEKTLLVGNDLRRTSEELRDLQVVTPPEVTPVKCTSQAAEMIRDLTAIAMTGTVVAGRSLFSRVGALIGGTEPLDARSLLTNEAARELLTRALKDAEGSENLGFEDSLNCEYLRNVLLEPHDRSIDRELLRIARRADALNPTYVLAAAADSLRRGDPRTAIESLEAALTDTDFSKVCRQLVRFELDIDRGTGWSIMTTHGGFLRPEDWVALESHLSDVPAAAAFLAAQALAVRDMDRYRIHSRALRRSGSPFGGMATFVESLLDLPERIPTRTGGFAIEPRSDRLSDA